MNNNTLIPEGLDHEISLRIEKIKEQLKVAGLDAVLVASNANIFYTSGRYFRGYVLVSQTQAPVYLIIKPVGMTGKDMYYIRKPEQIVEVLEQNGIECPARLGLEFDALSYSDISRLIKAFPQCETVNGSGVLRAARMVKTDYEIEQMKEDAAHQVAVYQKVPSLWKIGMTDVEFQIEIERVLRLEGALGYTRAFGPQMEINCGSLLAGNNADEPSPYEFALGGAGTSPSLPVGANGETIRPGETVMVDMSGAFNGYQSDLTRTWRVGDVTPLARKAHECSRAILRHIEEMARPGVKLADLYHAAIEIVTEHELNDYFMGHRQQVKFIGHGVGIDLNESPVITPSSKDTLKENMTIAIEPKFVIPGTGAVGVENTYVVRNNGLECITVFPEDLAEL